MNDPIKIIHRYKNNNKKIRYHIYIYVGNLIPKEIKIILNEIKELSFYDTLLKITKIDNETMRKKYGNFWLKYFFCNDHIKESIKNIKNDKKKINKLKTKFGDDWYNLNIETIKLVKKLRYSFQEQFQLSNMRKKLNQQSTTTNTENINKNEETNNEKKIQGGNEDININKNINKNQDEEQVIDDINDILEDNNEVIDIDEIEKLYKSDDVIKDENLENTMKLISKALDVQVNEQKYVKNLIKFDEKDWNQITNQKLSETYNKYYVYTQYIFRDDTIKNIKKKITISIENKKIIKNSLPVILPSRQYLWTKYKYYEDTLSIEDQKIKKKDISKEMKDKIGKVMLGQKWIRKNELLKIKVEPSKSISDYEYLKGKLKNLKDNIQRLGIKIKRDDDQEKILEDYSNFMINNEIYMCDIYNELGKGYNPNDKEKKNLYETFIKVYYFDLKYEDLEIIIDFLNGKIESENKTLIKKFTTINNDMKIETEIVNLVENLKNVPKLYNEYFFDNNVIHINIHTNLEFTGKLNLFLLFDNFIVDDTKYQFVQFQTNKGDYVYKFNDLFTNDQRKILIAKWFEHAPYGISFKIKTDLCIDKKDCEKNDHYISIKIESSGRLEYKMQWKEKKEARWKDVLESFIYVDELLKKLNSENKKIKFKIPNKKDYKYAFINTIQKFKLPKKKIINHNILSNFARYFFPYISVEIEPKKRKKKNVVDKEKSKYGTYLRYKRISEYKNESKIENRIVYLLRNYDVTYSSLKTKIADIFNMTDEMAEKYIDIVKQKYPKLKKSRRVLKQIKDLPKYQTPGISISIQGKTIDNYKIKINGARSKKQLDNITSFVKILLYLYIDTYIYKNKDREKLLTKLKNLTKIAKRRYQVIDIVRKDYQSNVKDLLKLDKERLAFTPVKGEHQYTRLCQNSGKNKRRRVQIYSEKKIGDLRNAGYSFNKKSGFFEKNVTIKHKGKKKNVTLRALKQISTSGTNNLYYTCDPKKNGEHIYIGFLSKAKNPYGHCMPCCFKKDHMYSKNTDIRNNYLSCIGKKEEKKVTDKLSTSTYEKLYVLKSIQKIQPNRIVYPEKYLDIFLNKSIGNEIIIKNNYLVQSKSGYYIIYGVDDSITNTFLSAIANSFNLDIDDVKIKIKNILKTKYNNSIFTSLNNGDIKTQFKSIDNFVKQLDNNKIFGHIFFKDLVELPNVLYEDGVNIFILEHHDLDYTLICTNSENLYNYNNLERKNVIIIKYKNNYYPIYLVKKSDKNKKNIYVQKIFDKNITIEKLIDYQKINCSKLFEPKYLQKYTAKYLYNFIKNKLPNITINYQLIDNRNKCIYLILNNNSLIPVHRSGCIYDLKIKNNITKYIYDINKTINNYKPFQKIINPIRYFYYDKYENEKYNIIAIGFKNKLHIPIINIYLSTNDINQIAKQHNIENFSITENNLDMDINNAIYSGPNNIIVDQRMKSVGYEKYKNESYNIFKLEFSNFLNKNKKLKNKISEIIKDKSISNNIKTKKIKKIIYMISDKKLYNLFIDIISETNKNLKNDIDLSKNNKTFINKINKLPDNLENYKIKNKRTLCENYKNYNKCNSNMHCKYHNNKCKFSLTSEFIIKYINKISSELVYYKLKSLEILGDDKYYVSDIINSNIFTKRKNQKIIKSSNLGIKNIIEKIFGDLQLNIGRKSTKKKIMSYEDIELKEYKEYYSQEILPDNKIIFRAFANAYYWFKHKYKQINFKNLGFSSNLQIDIANYFKGQVIDYLLNENNIVNIQDEIINLFNINKEKKNVEFKYQFKKAIKEFLIKINKNFSYTSNYIIELFCLHKIYNIPIIIYDDFDNIIYIFNKGNFIFNDLKKHMISISKFYSINLKYIFVNRNENKNPINIHVLHFRLNNK